MADKSLLKLMSEGHDGILVTLKRDGRPQLSNVSYAYDEPTNRIRVSVRDGLAKVHNLRRDPRASFHVTASGFGAYAVAEGAAELSPVAADPHDATVDELVDVYRAAAGEHPDWDDYRAAMVADQRLVIRVPVEHLYGWAGYSS